MICVEIDELTPCLIDVHTNDMVETAVIKVRHKKFLQKFNKKNGWYTSWSALLKNNEIYALVIKGTVDVQGLVALRHDIEMRALFISWMAAAPHNNPLIMPEKKYSGVGGHLFAIAESKSEEYGYHGEMTGFAANEKLEEHYIKKFNAVPIHMLHPHHIVILAEDAHILKEVYTYEWTDDER